MELTTIRSSCFELGALFMMSKIQNLNGTHNIIKSYNIERTVVYDVKDTKFEWNSQLNCLRNYLSCVVYDVKDTKFEWNSQHYSKHCYSEFSCL